MARNRQQLDSSIRVVTPENIGFQYQAAGPFRRLPAFLIDLALRMMIFLVIVWALSLTVTFVSSGLAEALILVSFFLLQWFYGGLFEALMNGQTPGKRLLGLRVLTIDGQPINGLQAIMRNVLGVVDMMPLASAGIFFPEAAAAYVIPTYVLGLAAMSMNSRFQRLGDLVCGTMVVVEERHWLTGIVRLDDSRVAQLNDYIPVDFQISRSLSRALAHYVERRRFLSQPRRREIARHLGDPLVRQFGLPADTSHDLLLCTLYYRAFIADRGGETETRPLMPPVGRAAPVATAAGSPTAGPLAEHGAPAGVE